jgi:hypothetical protein
MRHPLAVASRVVLSAIVLVAWAAAADGPRAAEPCGGIR